MAYSKRHSHRRRRHHRSRRGGDSLGRVHTDIASAAPYGAESSPSLGTTLDTTGNVRSMDGTGPVSNMKGGRRHHRTHHRRHHKRRGGSMLATAAVPFGLFGIQKYFQRSRVNPLKRVSRSARRTIKRVF